MAKEPSSIIDNMTSPSSSPSPESFIGSFISVTSKSDIRYEGVLYFLNPQDSTFGLKDVRSYGTEGRRKNGQEVPPSDKFYEYILFRGSDIKDLKVITNRQVQREETLHTDPAIIQMSNYHVAPSTASKSMSAIGGPLTASNFYSESSVSYARPKSSILPSPHSGSELGIRGSQLTHTASSSYGMPTQLQGYSGVPGNATGAQQHSLSSTPMLYPFQNQSSTTITTTNISDNIPCGHSPATPSSICLNVRPTSMPHIDSLSSKPSQPFHRSTLLNSSGSTLPFSLPYQNASSIEAQMVDKIVPEHISSLPVQLLPYSMPSVSDTISDSSLSQQQALLAPNLSQPRLSEHSLSKNMYPDQKYMDALSSISLNFSSSATTPAVQPQLLPLPPASQKLQPCLQFSEEFDFQAMNKKFNKDEIWDYLGKANQRAKVEGVQNATSSRDLRDDNRDLTSNSDPKPAYNKDDFFDAISRNSLGRGARDVKNQLPERVKMESETFGNSQRRIQFDYGGHRAGHGQHQGPYNWGRGYNYGYRGLGRYM